MTMQERAAKYTEAAEEFNRRTGRSDGARVANGLDAGLTVLRDSLFVRLHHEVEKMLGVDSLLIPVSVKQTEIATKMETEWYQIAECLEAVKALGYLVADLEWYLGWLARLRLGQPHIDGKAKERIGDYLAKTPDQRRLAFSNVLAKTLPESRRAPLVLFHLFPLSVQVATALAFGDHLGAGKLRNRQVGYLPAIADCRSCHGKVLENGEQCRGCGNPLWKSEWLTATD